jgi:hypothetical protein
MIGLTEYLTIVPVGQYNITELMDYLQANISGPTFTYTISPLTGKISMTFTVALVMYSSGIGSLIGLEQIRTAYYPNTAMLTVDMPGVPNLSGPREFYLCSRILAQGTNSILVNGLNLPIFAIIPNTVPYGGINQYLTNDAMMELKTYSALQNIQYIDIQVRDNMGQLVDFNGSDIMFNILVYSNNII